MEARRSLLKVSRRREGTPRRIVGGAVGCGPAVGWSRFVGGRRQPRAFARPACRWKYCRWPSASMGRDIRPVQRAAHRPGVTAGGCARRPTTRLGTSKRRSSGIPVGPVGDHAGRWPVQRPTANGTARPAAGRLSTYTWALPDQRAAGLDEFQKQVKHTGRPLSVFDGRNSALTLAEYHRGSSLRGQARGRPCWTSSDGAHDDRLGDG